MHFMRACGTLGNREGWFFGVDEQISEGDGMKKIVVDVTGKRYIREWKPGPKPKGYVKILVNLPIEYLELMRWKNEECGGCNSVSEQIRQAVRGALCGLIYISLVKH